MEPALVVPSRGRAETPAGPRRVAALAVTGIRTIVFASYHVTRVRRQLPASVLFDLGGRRGSKPVEENVSLSKVSPPEAGFVVNLSVMLKSERQVA